MVQAAINGRGRGQLGRLRAALLAGATLYEDSFFRPAARNSIISRRHNRFPHASTKTSSLGFFSAGWILVIRR